MSNELSTQSTVVSLQVDIDDMFRGTIAHIFAYGHQHPTPFTGQGFAAFAFGRGVYQRQNRPSPFKKTTMVTVAFGCSAFAASPCDASQSGAPCQYCQTLKNELFSVRVVASSTGNGIVEHVVFHQGSQLR